MKRLLIGCGIISIILFCLVVGAGLWAFFKVKKFGEEFQQIPSAYVATNNAYPFTIPNPPVMDVERLRIFLKVQDTFWKSISSNITLISRMREATLSNKRPDVSLRDFAFIGKLPQIIQTHPEALRQYKMSGKEYFWYSKIMLGTSLKAIQQGKDIGPKLQGIQDKLEKFFTNTSSSQGSPPTMSQLQEDLKVANIPLLDENIKAIIEVSNEFTIEPQMFFIDSILGEISESARSQPNQSGAAPTPVPLREAR